jgi:hypothetical protein
MTVAWRVGKPLKGKTVDMLCIQKRENLAQALICYSDSKNSPRQTTGMKPVEG